MRWIVSILLFVIVLLPVGCFLDTGDEGYNVSGTVTLENGEALYGIQIRLGTMIAVTNTDGYYKFKDISYNKYYIEADPYKNTIYDFKPVGYLVTVSEDKKINFVAYR